MMKKLFLTLVVAMVVLLIPLSATFAATYYVDATNGDDLNNGLSATNDAGGVGPFQTIGVAVTAAVDGDIINIAAANTPGYTEAVTIAKSLTLVGYQLDANTEVKIIGKLTINGAGKTVSIGESGSATILLDGSVDLIAGALTIDGANVSMTSGNTITRTAGTIDEAPTVQAPGALNVTYDGAADITAGAELPADLKAGTLTNAITAAKTLTIGSSVAVNNFVQNNAGSTTINGNLSSDATVAVSSTGTLTVNGDVTTDGDFTTAGTSKVAVTGTITLDTDVVLNHNSTGTFDAGAVVGSVSISIAGGNLVVIDNQNTGDLTIGTVTLTPVMLNNGTDESVVATIKNTNTGDLTISGTITGNMVEDSDADEDDMLLVYLDADGASGGTVTLGSANSIDNVVNDGTLTINGDLTLTNVAGVNHDNNSSTINGTGILIFANGGSAHTLANAGSIVGLQIDYATTIDDAAAKVITINGNVVANADLTIDGSGNAATDKITGTLTVASGKTVTNSTDLLEVAGNATVAGTFQSQAAATFKGDVTVTGKFNVDAATTVEGNISQTGAGVLDVDAALTVKGDWENASSATTTDIAVGALDVDGTFSITGTGTTTLRSASTFGGFNQTSGNLETIGAITFTMEGDFTRTNGGFDVIAAVYNGDAGDGGNVTINFTGSNAATITAGPQLYLYDLNINKTAGAIVTITQSLIITHDLAVASTAGADFGTKTFTVQHAVVWDGAMTSTGGGGLRFDTDGATLSGDGTLSNITVAMTNPAHKVTIPDGEQINFSGTVALLKGFIDVISTGAATDISPVGTSAAVTLNPENSAGITLTGGGTFNVDAVDYDLTYTGVLTGAQSVTAGTSEFDPAHIKDLTFSTSGSVVTILSSSALTVKNNVTLSDNALVALDAGAPFSLTIKGALSVGDDAVLSGGSAGNTITLDKDGATHVVKGQITAASILTVDATGVTISGAGADLDVAGAELANLVLATDAEVTVADIQNIAGVVTTNATSTLTVGLTQNSTTPADNDNGFIGGVVTLGGTAFTMTSDIIANANVDINTGTFAFGANELIMNGGNFDGAANVTYTAAAGGTLEIDVACNVGTNGETLPALLDVDATPTLSSNVVLSGGLDLDADLDLNSLNLTVSGDDIDLNADIVCSGGAPGPGKMIVTGSTLTAETGVGIENLEINSDGTVTFASNNTSAKTFTVSGTLTQTKGNIDLGINHIALTGSSGDCFARTAGSWTATTGQLIINGVGAAQDISPGDGWSVPNLTINNTNAGPGVVEFDDDKDFTVTNSLVLQDGNLDADQDSDDKGELHLANGCTVTRDASASTLVRTPVFDGTVDVVYYDPTLGAGNGTTGNEMPGSATALNDLTVNALAGGDLVLDKDITVNGKLTLANKLDATTPAPDKSVTMADGTTLELKIDGTAALDKDLVKLGVMDIIYNGATATSPRELGVTTTAATHTAQNVTVKGDVALDAATTFTGALNLNGGDLDLNGFSLYLTSDFSQTNAADFFVNNGGTNGTLILSGSESTSFTLKGNQVIEDDIDIAIAKDADDDVVTLSGGNLDFQAGENKVDAPAADVFGKLILTKGILNTGDKMVVLAQGEDDLGRPMQGFDRTDGVVVGKVKKLVSKLETVERANMQFPLGTPNCEYRPSTFFFRYEPQTSFFLTVGHNNVSPGGTNGIPFTTDIDNIEVTSYPDFAWSVTSDVSLAPSYKFDMELQAENYPFYETDNIENIRMIRRAQGAETNEWRLQGSDANYDNQTVSAAWPLVKVIDATGGLTTQGSIFTFSQSSQAPRWTLVPQPAAIDEKATAVYEYKAVDEDINEWPMIEAVGELPSFVTLATFATNAAATSDSATITLAPTYADSGTYSFTLRATDGTEFTDTTITVVVNNVNQPPAFTTVPDDVTMDELTPYTFTYVAADGDDEAVYYAVVDSPATDVAITSAGVVTFTTEAGLPEGQVDTLVVSITDSVDTPAVFVNDTLLITVVKQVAPVYTAVLVDQTVNTGDTVAFTYTATDGNTPVGDELTFAIVDAPEGASIVAATGVFEWVVADEQVGDSILVVVSVTDKTDKAVNDTAYVNVKSAVLGDASLNGYVSAYDASLVLQHVAGIITMTGDSLTLADATQNGTVSALDASYILQKVAGNDSLFKGLAKALFSTGEIGWEVKATVNQEVVTVPIVLTSAKNVYAVEYRAEVDPFTVEIANVAANLPKGWQMAKNIKDGVLTVAMAGITPLTDAQIASIELRILNKDAAVMMTGSATVNENAGKSLEKLVIRQIPAEFKLSRNYPNPFNPTTNISFQLPENSKVTIAVYDILGNRVRTLVNENKAAGYYTVQWNGLNDNGMSLSSGTYFYQIQAGQYISTKKMLLIK
jgi:cytoskeletal protein CcmA (bactofilin family)